ncbi:MAG: flagellar filament capping protein FliD, partial [Nitrospinae bacterium]|nr:flagellar filament capping protein FliD [Nitrospinota bacterium]
MAISVDGLISGMDTTSIVKQLIELEGRPITLKQGKQDDLATQKLAWQEINTKLLAVETASEKLNSTSKFGARSATFANNDPTTGTVLSVTAGSSSVVGSFDVTVTQLAAAQKSALDQTFSSSSSAVGASGTLTLNDGTAHNIALTTGMTLEQIKNAINDSGAALNATIINSGTTASPAYQIILTGDETGAANSFTHSASLDAGAFSFTQKVAAKNALMTVDEVAVTKSSNTITDVIDGATLNLQTLGSGTITLGADFDGIVANVKGFVDAYNEAAKLIQTHNSYNQDKNTKGALFGNATLNTIYNQMRSIMTTAIKGGDVSDTNTLSSLAQIGIKNDNENILTVDETKLRDALKDNFAETQ